MANRIHSPARRFCSVAFALMLTGLVELRSEEEALDIAYAEMQPLAPYSLLLDMVRLENGRLVAVGERGHVVFSDDGETWVQAEHVPTRSTLTTVTVAGGRLWAGGHDTAILTSGDRGNTWTRQYFDIERQQPVMDLHFGDEENGFAIGAYGLMLVTSDGGASWEERHVSDDGWHLNGILNVGDGVFVIAAEAGFTYRSTDHGATWEEIAMPYAGSMFDISAAPGDCIIVFGLRGHVQESCDAGVTWIELETGTEASLLDGLTTAGMTYLVGNSGVVLIMDENRRFRQELHPSGVDFAGIVSLGSGRFMLVGEDGTHRYPVPQKAEEDA